jgi:hypothetical protein
MSDYIKERYTPIKVAVDSTVTIYNDSVGGFLAITAGTLDIKKGDGTSIFPAVLTVEASVYYPFPAFIGTVDGQAVTAGGASGTLFA